MESILEKVDNFDTLELRRFTDQKSKALEEKQMIGEFSYKKFNIEF
jgi:hypothetical protein